MSAPNACGPAPQTQWRVLAELRQPDLAGGLATVVRELGLPAARLAQLQTAVAEAGWHARELDQAQGPVRLRVLVAAHAEAQALGCAARGWGFFIIETSGLPDAGRGLELFLYREGAPMD